MTTRTPLGVPRIRLSEPHQRSSEMGLTPEELSRYAYNLGPVELAGSPPPTEVGGVMVEPEVLDEYMRSGRLIKVQIAVGKSLHRSYWLAEAVEASSVEPMHVGVDGTTHIWLYQGKAYTSADADLTSEDVLALINETVNRRRLRLEKAHALQAMTDGLDQRERRPSIPPDVKMTVWRRDGGRCVECDSNELLEFDHIIPLAMGGSNTMRNLQLLCEPCNNRKGATLG
jgi:hypothetical protein